MDSQSGDLSISTPAPSGLLGTAQVLSTAPYQTTISYPPLPDLSEQLMDDFTSGVDDTYVEDDSLFIPIAANDSFVLNSLNQDLPQSQQGDNTLSDELFHKDFDFFLDPALFEESTKARSPVSGFSAPEDLATMDGDTLVEPHNSISSSQALPSHDPIEVLGDLLANLGTSEKQQAESDDVGFIQAGTDMLLTQLEQKFVTVKDPVDAILCQHPKDFVLRFARENKVLNQAVLGGNKPPLDN